MTMKSCIIILLIGSLCNSLVDTKNALFETLNSNQPKRSEPRLLQRLLIYLLKHTKPETKRIIVYDDHLTFKETLAKYAKISVTLFSDFETWRSSISQYPVDDVKVDVVILVIRMEIIADFIHFFFYHWHYNRDCFVYIFPEQYRDCDGFIDALGFTMKNYFPKVYFFCLMNSRTIYAYTQDSYGDTEPPYWNKVYEDFYVGKNRMFYQRSCRRDMKQLRLGFDFNRTDPSNQAVIFGLTKNQFRSKVEEENLIYDEYAEQLMPPFLQEAVLNLQKLLKLKFLYLINANTYNDSSRTVLGSLYEAGVDAMLRMTFFSFQYGWCCFYPTRYEHFGIISHGRGLMTPLEKIAKFYGKLTLLSLLIIMFLTFIVMRFTIKKPSSAIFNILRLLINTEIIAPINTWRLKLFYAMIFLYFLVIHATFSGHLSKFLTEVEYRSNIDTMEQLENPTITKIYAFAYASIKKDNNIIQKKVELISRSNQCDRIVVDQSYVCIAPLVILQKTVYKKKNINTTFYVSKNTFGLSYAGYQYRQGFPLNEKFNRAIMTLFETNIISQKGTESRENEMRVVIKAVLLSRTDYRPITMSDLSFAFIFLMIGNCVGLISFLVEILYKNRRNKLK